MDLLSLIAYDVDLRQHGKEWVGLCPFHSERTPSFYVSNDLYHCFGCGAGGDDIDYVRRKHGMTYSEALQYLNRDENPVQQRVERLRMEKRRELKREEQEKANTVPYLMRLTSLAGQLAVNRGDADGFQMFYRQWKVLWDWDECPLEVIQAGTELVTRYLNEQQRLADTDTGEEAGD